MFLVSYLDPVATSTKTVVVLVLAIGMVRILKPFGNVVFLYIIMKCWKLGF